MRSQKNCLYLTKEQAFARKLYLTDGQVKFLKTMFGYKDLPFSALPKPKFVKKKAKSPEPCKECGKECARQVTCYDEKEEALAQQQAKELEQKAEKIDISDLSVVPVLGTKIRGYPYINHKIKAHGRLKHMYAEMKQQGYLRPDETADILGCCRTSLTEHMARGLIPYRRGKFYFFERKNVENYLKKTLAKCNVEIPKKATF